MRTIIALAATVTFAAFSSSVAFAEDTKPTDTSTAVMQIDRATWIKTVASASFFEIESSKIALEKSSSEEVKAFAQQMIDDHTKAGEKLASILEKEGTPLPPRDLTQKQSDAIDTLKKVDGEDFDATYVDLQRDAHMEAVSLFTSYAAKPDDPTLGAFATETLPTLEMHLEHVKALVVK